MSNCANLTRHFASVLVCLAVAACGSTGATASGLALFEGEAVHDGITISVFGPGEWSTLTNEDGLWQIKHLPPGRYVVVAQAQGVREETRTAEFAIDPQLTSVKVATLSFTPTGSVIGRVVNEAGDPIAASVNVTGLRAGASTGTDGSFAIAQVPGGLRDVQIFANGYDVRELRGVEVHRLQTTTLPTVALRQRIEDSAPGTGDLVGTALGSSTEGPIEVWLNGTRATSTDDRGAFALRDVPLGPVTLAFKQPGASAEVQAYVVRGSTGFLENYGSPLEQNPIILGAGTRVSNGTTWWVATSGRWHASVAYRSNQVRVFDDSHEVLITADASVFAPTFTTTDTGICLWFVQNLTLKRLLLPAMTIEVVTDLAATITESGYQLPLHVVGDAAIWSARNNTILKKQPHDSEPMVVSANAQQHLALPDQTLLVVRYDGVNGTTVDRVKLDGSQLQTFTPKPLTGYSWYVYETSSPDLFRLHSQYASNEDFVLRVSDGAHLPLSVSPDGTASYVATGGDLAITAASGQVVHAPISNSAYLSWVNGRGHTLLVLDAAKQALYYELPEHGSTPLKVPAVQFTIDSNQPNLRHHTAVTSTGGLTSQVLDVAFDTWSTRVLADDAFGGEYRVFIALERGVVFTRRRELTGALDVFFVDRDGVETRLGQVPASTSYLSYFKRSPAGDRLAYFTSERDHLETRIFDLTSKRSSFLAASYLNLSWVDERQLLYSFSSSSEPSLLTGIFLWKAP